MNNVTWHENLITRQMREQQNGHRGCVVWFTGLSGSGKSTIANTLDKRLYRMGAHSTVLDGDNVRHGLCGDLGFSAEDREENIRRIGHVAGLFAEAGIICLTAFISPYARDREKVRSSLPAGDFIEVFVDTPLAVCEKRDPKGLYAKARKGEIKGFTGIDDPYEAPPLPELVVSAESSSPAEIADEVLAYLDGRMVHPGRHRVG